jgi:hypothetical protein
MHIATRIMILVGAAGTLLSVVTWAESEFDPGPGNGIRVARAHVDFRVVIPKILYLRVGSGTTYPTTLASNGTIDMLRFAPAATAIGNGTAVAGTGGDLGSGVETAAIISNSGNVTLNATASGALGNGFGDSIPYTQIKTAAAALTVGYTLLSAPVLTNATSANIVLTAPATKVIRADARWAFSYANTITPPAGTYGGANVNNGRVVYTASMP